MRLALHFSTRASVMICGWVYADCKMSNCVCKMWSIVADIAAMSNVVGGELLRAVASMTLSSPPPISFSLHYCTIDTTIAILNTLDQGALMGKIDLQKCLSLDDPSLQGRSASPRSQLAGPIVCGQVPSIWLTLFPSHL